MPESPKSLTFPVLVFGFTSVTAQIVLMRELVILFYGNELSLGTMLGVWLLWTAAGSALLPRFFRIRNPRGVWVGLQLYCALLLPVLPLLVRWSRGWLGLTPGEMAGYTAMLCITLIVLAPLCLASGFLFALACHMRQDTQRDAGRAIAAVYMTEAAGSGLGGLLASLVFLRWLSVAQIVCVCALLNLISALYAARWLPAKAHAWKMLLASLLILGAGTAAGLRSGGLQAVYDCAFWKYHTVIQTRNSIHGNIAVIRVGEQYSFFVNGLIQFTVPDRSAAEASVHYAMLQHPSPERIMLIGGGLGGEIAEILKYSSVRSLDYVLLDPALVEVFREVLPPAYTSVLDQERVHIRAMDARHYIKIASDFYDVIIVNLPNPYTAQLNRFYTLEFFKEVRSRLSGNGLISLQIPASENAIGPELARYISTVNATLSAVFSRVILLPGGTVRIMASDSLQLTDDPWMFVDRLRESRVETQYVREYTIPYDMSRERREYLHSMVLNRHEVPKNYDFFPVAYFYDTLLWATTFSAGFTSVFIFLSRLRPLHWLLFISCMTILLFVAGRRRKHTDAAPILYSVFSIGFSEISLQITAFLAFQILFGYVYHQVSILIAAYMAGLTLGSSCWATPKNKKAFPMGRFKTVQAVMAAFPVVLCLILIGLQRSGMRGALFMTFSWTFAMIPFFAGFIGGYQFPLANRLTLAAGGSPARTAGFLYGFDLAGSSLGAILTSAFLIPILGIYSTLGVLAFMNGCCWILLSAGRSTSARF